MLKESTLKRWLYLILLASLIASVASIDGDGSLTMDLSNESSSLSLSDKALLMLYNETNVKLVT